MRILFAKLSPLATMPTRGTTGSAGLDLCAAVGYGEEITIARFERALVPTGLQIQLPEGFEAQVRPRSGLALRHGITVLNSPGTIDSDYLGAISILLINLGNESFVVRQGDCLAQLVVAPVVTGEAFEVARVDARRTTRGAGGFGSTSRA